MKTHLKSWLALAAFAAVSLAFAAPALSAQCGGIKFSDKAQVGGTELTLNGLGMREATMLNIDVYVAGMYVENKSTNGPQLAASDQTKLLKLYFVRDVDKSDITSAYEEGFKKAAGGEFSKHRDKLQKVNGWMSSVEKGDTHTYTYVPGEGLTVEVDGEKKGTIEGEEFAAAFYNIWLGPSPPNAGLKAGLLGGPCG
jgi:hypothetical protein